MQAVELNISLQGVDLQQFDVLEVWRSTETANGPYSPLTQAGSRPARIPELAPDPPAAPEVGRWVNIDGKSLFLLSGATALSVEIDGADPLTLSEVALQIIDQTLGAVSAYVVGALLVLETREVGGHARLEVTGGDVAGLVGLELNAPAFGREPHIPLVSGVIQYSFTDQQGSTEYFYKVRLRSSLRNTVSEFSDPLSPLGTPEVTDTAIGFLDLTDMDGSALEAREVRLYSRFSGQLKDGRVVAGFSKNALTDKNGHAEFVLVRGLQITVAVAGTNMVRDLVVPEDMAVSRFNILDPALGSNDVFKVQVPNIPYAVRRST